MENQSIIWDEYEIAQFRAKEFLDSEEAKNEEEALEMALSDGDMIQWEFEDFKEQFSQILKDISPEGLFYVEGKNMGWRRLSGHAEISANSAKNFIERAFPKTAEWTLRGVYLSSKKVLEYSLFHHDAPTGEFYTVKANE